MKAQELIQYVFTIAPNPLFARENTFEFGDGSGDVSAVGTAWWITGDMLRQFPDHHITLGLSHERVVYDVDPDYVWGKPIRTEKLPANRFLAEFTARHRIAIHRLHSSIDPADWGQPRALFRELGWDRHPTDWSRGIPVVERPPVPLRDLIREVRREVRLPFVRFDGDLDRVVRRIAAPWGGLCQWRNGPACAVPLGLDCVLGGDIIDGVVRLAREEGWAVADAMHHATELAAMRDLARSIETQFPRLRVHYFGNTVPWAVMS